MGGRGSLGDGRFPDLAAVVAEMRRVAAGYLRSQRAGHTLQPTALVNEAYARLLAARGGPLSAAPEHLKAQLARAMSHILVDHARRRGQGKRGGGRGTATLAAEALELPRGVSEVDLIDLGSALDELGERHPAWRETVELRFFAGLTIEEAAVAAGCDTTTIDDRWRLARGFLARRLKESA